MNTVIVFVLALGIVFALPFASIWSVNTLFLTAIPYSIETWLAAFWLNALLMSNYVKVKK
jgi:hypothetical protein